MNDFTEAQVIEHAQLVMKGKPCSVLPIKQKDIQRASNLVSSQGAKCHVKRTKTVDWAELWIYKREDMRQIIDFLPNKPEKAIEHFILGCAFGYSIDSILDFIKK